MKLSTILVRRLHWINLPGALLIALLQRTPVLRVVATGGDLVVASPVGTVLRSAVATVASLGALHTLAGATQFQFTPSNPASGAVGTSMSVFVNVTGAAGGQNSGSYRITGSLPPGLSVVGINGNNVVNTPNGVATISGTPTTAGSYTISIVAYEFANGPQQPGNDTFGPISYVFQISGAAATAPAISSQPQSLVVGAGQGASFTVFATGTPGPTFQWSKNGSLIAEATSATLSLFDVQPANTGIFTLAVTNSAGTVTSDPVTLGISTTNKVVGTGAEIGTDIPHPNTNIFDQILPSGAAVTITADAGQATRTSFIDLTNDIVQVEFSGAGTLSLLLDNPSGPAAPVNYTQPSVAYMKGHAGIIITGANETTNVSVFTVGRATAFDPTGGYNILQPISATNDPANNGSSLFAGQAGTNYDGVADIAFIAISSTNGQFGGVRTANGSYFAAKGLTGIYAPGVQFNGPVFLGDLNASSTATPVLLLGFASDTRITGGDLFQNNGQPVKVSGVSILKFTAGIKSSGVNLPAQNNQGTLMQDGNDVTAQIVANPP